MNDIGKKVIGITGGTGSFGSTFLKKIIDSKSFNNEIVVFSRDETKQESLRRKINNERVSFMIGDVRDTDAVDKFCKRVDMIFHAAALKYVPVCEFNPIEGIKTNIIGSENILKFANANNVEKVILLSTDKAVEPINAMGMTKALMEKLGIANSLDKKYKTKICITRYGNVLGSRGSVIPFFVDRIKRGMSLTITDPEMTRFVMSLDESVRLVNYALANGQSGEIFVQKSPAASVLTIANAVLKLMNSNQKLEIIGARHSEKKHEVLLSSNEMNRAVERDNYFIITPDNRGINYETKRKHEKNVDYKSYNSKHTDQLNVDQLIDYIKKQRFWTELIK